MDELFFNLAKTTCYEDARALLESAYESTEDVELKNKIAGTMAFQKINSDHNYFIQNLREILYNQFCDVIKLAKK